MGWGGFRASPLSFCQTALKNLCPVRCPLISGDNYVASGPLSGQSAFLPVPSILLSPRLSGSAMFAQRSEIALPFYQFYEAISVRLAWSTVPMEAPDVSSLNMERNHVRSNGTRLFQRSRC